MINRELAEFILSIAEDKQKTRLEKLDAIEWKIEQARAGQV